MIDKIYTPINNGELRLIDVMGSDADICRDARTSHNRRNVPVDKEKDERLINRLMREYHTSPFEMAELKFLVTCPILVARQWLRHRTANVSEASARYTVTEDEFYFPDIEDVRGQHSQDKQMGGESLSEGDSAYFVTMSQHRAGECYEQYKNDLSSGIARELARMNLPQNIMTTFVWKIDLHNLLHFMRLRSDGHAQLEIRRYSECLEEIVAELFPMTYAAWVNHRRDAVTLSSYQFDVVQACLAGDGYYGMFEGKDNLSEPAKVALRELMKKLGLPS